MNLPDYIDPTQLFVVSFSGGKDSVATWLYLERELGLRVVCAMGQTLWESEETDRYVDRLQAEHGLPLVKVQARVRDIWEKDPPERVPRELWDAPLGMEELARLKGRAPSRGARFCTTILKLKPMRRFVATLREPLTMACGVRAEESPKRAGMATWQLDEFMGRNLWLPIHAWTAEQVFDLHKRHNVPPNPLYLKGCSRVGCFPCILASKSDIAVVAADPAARQRVVQLEQAIGFTFFTAGTASKAYQSKVDPNSGKRINTAEDVFRWALEQQPAFKEDGLFAGQELPLDYGDDLEAEACSSVYGLCE